MAKVPPPASKFTDVFPKPTEDQLQHAFISSLFVLAKHREWARDPAKFPAYLRHKVPTHLRDRK